jgi:SRSO17 transposase
VKYLSNLAPDAAVTKLVHLGKIRLRIEHDYRELQVALALDHFEGRSFTDWHRHLTLITAAHLVCALLQASPRSAAAA